jgi:hypothetical protein
MPSGASAVGGEIGYWTLGTSFRFCVWAPRVRRMRRLAAADYMSAEWAARFTKSSRESC